MRYLLLLILLSGCSTGPQSVVKYGKPATKVQLDAYMFQNGVLIEYTNYIDKEVHEVFFANPTINHKTYELDH